MLRCPRPTRPRPPGRCRRPTADGREAPRAAPALKEIKSPMVGTLYKAPEPGADPYVKVGSRITPGQTVCITRARNRKEGQSGGVEHQHGAAQPIDEFDTKRT